MSKNVKVGKCQWDEFLSPASPEMCDPHTALGDLVKASGHLGNLGGYEQNRPSGDWENSQKFYDAKDEIDRIFSRGGNTFTFEK